MRLPGQYYDAESGLHQNYFRNYDPEHGVYLEQDPLGVARNGSHRYLYVHGNPLGLIDPLGLDDTGIIIWPAERWATEIATNAAINAYSNSIISAANSPGTYVLGVGAAASIAAAAVPTFFAGSAATLGYTVSAWYERSQKMQDGCGVSQDDRKNCSEQMNWSMAGLFGAGGIVIASVPPIIDRFDRANENARAELKRRSNGHNNLEDAMRLAEWSRRMANEIDYLPAWLAGTGHELDGLLRRGQPWNEFIMDLHNNRIGRSTDGEVDSTALWTLPLKDDQYQPY